jgi:pimeloyl-ACP methyl ester carboxylesterase
MLKSTNIPASKRLTQGAPPKEPFIETQDGQRLFYQDWGTGQAIVFIHGWGLGAGMWEYQMTALSSQGLRCIAYDRRGCGRSDQPGQGYDYDTLADDLAAVIEQLDLRDVNLVGFSSGCGDIARYLSRYGRDRIAKTVLIGSITPFIVRTADNSEGLDPGVFTGMMAALERDRPQFLAVSAPSFFGAGLPTVAISSELMQWGIGLALQASPKATIEMVRTFSTDFRSDMAAWKRNKSK